MSDLLQQAFAAAAQLSPAEQDVIAARVLAEIAAENRFDQSIAETSDKLIDLASEAIAEHRAGKTEPLDPERL
ncbi:MAG: hypothetical protein JSS27_12190 [Planctomycetes bacterium]|nr:hypothetical protein [Planctomycetota bacterium]